MTDKNYEFVNSYNTNKLSTDDIFNIKRDINNKIILTDTYNNYLAGDINEFKIEYLNNVTNHLYFEAIQKIIYSYYNDKTYSITYDYIRSALNFKFLNKVINFKLISGNKKIDYYQDYIYSPNVKNFIENVTYKSHNKELYSHKIEEGPIIMEIVPKQIEYYVNRQEDLQSDDKNKQPVKKSPFVENYKNTLHKIVSGLYVFNHFKKDIPNVPYIFSYMECSGPTLDNKNTKIITWCDLSENENTNMCYFMEENIKGTSMKNFISNCSQIELSSLMFQYLNFLKYTKIHLYKYINKGTSLDNLMVVKLDHDIYIPIYTDEFIKKYLKTNVILYITDFSDSYIEYKYSSTRNIIFGSTVVLNNLKKDKFNFDYNYDVFKNDIYKYRTDQDVSKLTFVDKKIEANEFKKIKFMKKVKFNNYCLENYKNESKENFKKTEQEFFKFLNQELKKYDVENLNDYDNDQIIILVSNFNKFLMFLKGCLCFNFVNMMPEIYKVYNNIDLILGFRLDLSLRLNLLKSLKNSINKLPSISILGLRIGTDYWDVLKNTCFKLIGICLICSWINGLDQEIDVGKYEKGVAYTEKERIDVFNMLNKRFYKGEIKDVKYYGDINDGKIGMGYLYKNIEMKKLECFSEFMSVGKLFSYIPVFNGEITIEIYSMLTMHGMLLITGIYGLLGLIFGATLGTTIASYMLITVLFTIIACNVGAYILNPTSNIWNYSDKLINQLKNNGFLNLINYLVSKIKNNVYNLVWIFSKYKPSKEKEDDKKNVNKLISNKIEFTEDMKKMNIFLINKDANKKATDIINGEDDIIIKNNKILELLKEYSR